MNIDLGKYVKEALKEEYGVNLEVKESKPEYDWKIHDEMPDSSSVKVANARRKYLHYKSLEDTHEEQKWHEEVKRLENYSVKSFSYQSKRKK